MVDPLVALSFAATLVLLGVTVGLAYRMGYREGVKRERLRQEWEGQERNARILAKIDQYGLEQALEDEDERTGE